MATKTGRIRLPGRRWQELVSGDVARKTGYTKTRPQRSVFQGRDDVEGVSRDTHTTTLKPEALFLVARQPIGGENRSSGSDVGTMWI